MFPPISEYRLLHSDRPHKWSNSAAAVQSRALTLHTHDSAAPFPPVASEADFLQSCLAKAMTNPKEGLNKSRLWTQHIKDTLIKAWLETCCRAQAFDRKGAAETSWDLT